MVPRLLVVSLAIASVARAVAQDTPTLDLNEALRLARENNGTVRSARLTVESARADTRSAFSAFYPTVTPTVRQQNGRIEQHTGRQRGGTTVDQTDATLTASWLLLDSGARSLNVRRSESTRDASYFTSLETYRGVLFDVHTSFFNALRAQELLRVQVAGVERAKKLVERAELREQVGAGARKDILQAQADLANAQFNELSALNQVATSQADLKAILGWPQDELPALVRPSEPTLTMEEAQLAALREEAVANRASLAAARQRLRSSRYAVDLARLDAGVTFSARAEYDRSFSEDVSDQALLVLQASIPLFDGNRSREAVNSARLSSKAQEADLLQSERDVLADVESAYKEFTQNAPRYQASNLALRAAQLNYEAASGAFQEGAGDLIEVLTAQVSLTTAETNSIQALYDLLISEVRLKLVTGRALPGEDVNDE